jgi:hypothetical protein
MDKENVAHIHNGASFSLKNEIMSLSWKWMELEIIMLNEINQAHKDKYYMFSLICGSWGQDWNLNQNHESNKELLESWKGREKWEG